MLPTSPSSPAAMEGLQNPLPAGLSSPNPQPPTSVSTPSNPASFVTSNFSGLGSSVGAESAEVAAAQRTWKQALFPSDIPKLKFKLRYIPPSAQDAKLFGVCSMDAVKGELAVLDYTLVGFFLGKRPSFSFVKSSLLRQWKLKGNVEILQLPHGGFAFRFLNLLDRDSILDGDVFFVGGQPMFIRQWDRSLHTGGVLGLRKVPLWINLPGLPLHLWGEESLSAICSVLGNPLYSDRTTAMKTRLMFARVCVEFSGDSPLLESILIEDEVGMKYEQKVEYEWKPPQCTKCGVFGHNLCEVEEWNDAKILSFKDQQGPVEVCPAAESTPLPPLSNQGDADMEVNSGSSSGEEKQLDDGWQVFRARKKRPSGSGPSTRPKTRTHQHLVKGKSGKSAAMVEVGSVSTHDWSISEPGFSAQVCQPSLPPHLEKNSNFKPDSRKETCPLSNLEKAKLCLDSNGPQHAIGVHTRQEKEAQEVKGNSAGKAGEGSVSTSHWAATAHGTSRQVCQPVIPPSLEKNPHSKSGVRKDASPSTNLEKRKKWKDSIGSQHVLEDRTRPDFLNLGGPPPKSSAGHTPFPSRLSIMARDLRLGKVGSGPIFRPKNLTQSGRTESGQNVENIAQNNVPAGLALRADNGTNGPAIGTENETIPECLKATINHDMDLNAIEHTALDSHHELNELMQPDPGEDDDLPNVFLGPSMQLFENPDYMGCEELENQLKKDAGMSSGKGFKPTSSR